MSKVKIIPDLRFPEFENEGDWQKKPLEDVLQFQTGFPFDSEGFNEEGRGVRLIKNRDLKSDDKIVHYSKPYDEKYLVTNGDVLVGMDGDFTPIKWNKGVALLNQRVGRVLTNQKDDELFFLYFLSIHLKAIEEKTARTTDKHLSHSVVEKINEPIPKPKEQQKIASCLSSLDEIIATHSQKLDLLKDHKKGLMQNLFPQEGEKVPKYRFKEFENDGEWVEKTLIDTADKNVKWSFTGGPFGSNLMASDYKESGFRIIQLQNIGDGVFNDDNKIYASIEKADELLSCNIYASDIIISKMGDPVGRACIIPDTLHRSIMASDGIRLVVDETKYSKYFIYSLINSKRIRGAIEKKATGSTRKRIGLDTLREIELIVPNSPKEQQKIASCLSSLDALITAQAEKIEQLKLHKKGLMQGLFPKINE